MTFGNYDFRYVNNTNFMNGVQYRMGAASESSRDVASLDVNSVNDDSIPENVKKLNDILSRIDSSDKKVSEEDYNEITTLLFEMGFECDSRDDFDNNSEPEKNHYMLYKNDYEKKLCFTYNNGTDDVTVLIRHIMTEDEESNTEESLSVKISQIIAKIQDMLAGSKSDISTESILDLLEKNSCTNCNVREDSYTSDESGDDLTYIKLSFELAGMKYNVDLPQDIKIYDTSTFINREFTTEELNNEFKGEPVTVSVNSDKLSEIFDTVVSQDGEPIFYALNKASLDKLKNAGFSDEEINNMSIESLLVKLDAVKIEKTPIASLVENIQTQLNKGTGSSTEITQILRDNNCKNYNIKSERDEYGNINKFKATFTLYGKSYEIELNKDLNTYSSDTLSSLSEDKLNKYFAESVKKDGKAIMYSLNEDAINKLKEAGLNANSKISKILAALNEEEGKDVEDVENVENDTSSESVKSENINEIINKLQEMLNNGASYDTLMKNSPVKGKKYSNAAPIKEGNTLVGLKIDALQLTLPNGAIYNIELRRGNESFGVNEIESTTVNQGKEDEYTIGKEELINKYFSISVTKDGTGIIYYLNADGKAKLQEAKVSENDSMDKILQALASGLTTEDVKILNFCSEDHSEDPIGDLEELTKTEGITYTISNVSGDDVTIKITNNINGYSQDLTIRMTAENKSQISDIYIESVKNTLQKMLNDGASYDALMKNSPVKGKEYSNAVPIKEGNTLVGVKIDALKMFTGGPSYSLVLTKGAVYINSSDIENTEFKDENGQEIDKDIIISRYFDTAITDNDGNIKTYSLNNDALALLQSGTNHSIDEIFSVLNNNISSVDKNIITFCNQLENGSAAIADLQELVEITTAGSGEEKVSFSLEFIGNNKCKITITNKESGYSKSVSIDVTEDNATALKNLYLQKFVDNLQEVLDDDNSNYEKVIRSSSVKNKKYGSAEPLKDSDGNFAGLKFTDLNINGDLYTIELKKGQTTYLAEDIAAVADKAPRIFDYFDAVGTVKNSQGESENKFYVLNDKGKHLLGEPIPTSISEIVNTIAEKLSKAENAVEEFLSAGTRNDYLDEQGNLKSDDINNYLGSVGIFNPTIDEVDKTITYLTNYSSKYTVDMGHFDNNYVIYANSLPSNIEANLLTKYFTTIASVTEVDGKETPLYYALNTSNIDANFIASLKKLYTATDLNADEIKNLCAILANYDQAMSAYNEFVNNHSKNSDDFIGHTPSDIVFETYLDKLKKSVIEKVINANGVINTQFKVDDVKSAIETEWKNIVKGHLVNAFISSIPQPDIYTQNSSETIILEQNQTLVQWFNTNYFENSTSGGTGTVSKSAMFEYLKTEFGTFFEYNINTFDSMLQRVIENLSREFFSTDTNADNTTKTPIRIPTAKNVIDAFYKSVYETVERNVKTAHNNFKSDLSLSVEGDSIAYDEISTKLTITSTIENLNYKTIDEITSSFDNETKSFKTNVLKKLQTLMGGSEYVTNEILINVYNAAVASTVAALSGKGESINTDTIINVFAEKLHEAGISKKQELVNKYGDLLTMYTWLQTGFPSNGSEFLRNEDSTKNLGSQRQINWCNSSAQVDSAISENGELRPLFDNIIDHIEKWFSDNGKQAEYDTMFNNGKLAELITYVMKQTFTLNDGQSPYGIDIEDGKCYLGGFAQGFLKCFIDKMSNPDDTLRAIITDINTNAGKYHSCRSSYTEDEIKNMIKTVIENLNSGFSADVWTTLLIRDVDNRYFTYDTKTKKYTMKDNLAKEYKVIEEFINAFVSPYDYYKENYLENDLKSVLEGLSIDDSQQSEITKLELNEDGTIKGLSDNNIWKQIKTQLIDVIHDDYPVLAKYIDYRTIHESVLLKDDYYVDMENLVFNIWNEVVQNNPENFIEAFKAKFTDVLSNVNSIYSYTYKKIESTTPDDEVVEYSKEYWTQKGFNEKDLAVLFKTNTQNGVTTYTIDTALVNQQLINDYSVETDTFESIMSGIMSGVYYVHNSVINITNQTDTKTYGFTEEQVSRYFVKDEEDDDYYRINTEALKDLPDSAKTSLGALKAYLDTVETDKFSDHAEDIKALADSVDSFEISAPLAIGGTILVGGPLSSGHVDSIPGIVDKNLALASKFTISTDGIFAGDRTIIGGILDFASKFSDLLNSKNLLDLFKNEYGEKSVNKFILYMWNSTIGDSVFMTYDQLVNKMKENLKAILNNPSELFAVMDDLDNKISNCSTEADVKAGMTADEIKTKYHLNDKDIEILFNEVKDSNPKKYRVKISGGIFENYYISRKEVYENSYIKGFTGIETFAQALDKMMNNKVNAALLEKYGFTSEQIAKAYTVHMDGWYELKPEFKQQYTSLGAILEAISNDTAPSVQEEPYDKLSNHASDLASLKDEIIHNNFDGNSDYLTLSPVSVKSIQISDDGKITNNNSLQCKSDFATAIKNLILLLKSRNLINLFGGEIGVKKFMIAVWNDAINDSAIPNNPEDFFVKGKFQKLVASYFDDTNKLTNKLLSLGIGHSDTMTDIIKEIDAIVEEGDYYKLIDINNKYKTNIYILESFKGDSFAMSVSIEKAGIKETQIWKIKQSNCGNMRGFLNAHSEFGTGKKLPNNDGKGRKTQPDVEEVVRD